MNPRRSLTLVELMITVVLLLAMAALILPAMLSSMEERTFETAADVTNEQLRMARDHAQATGAAVEVTYRPETSQVQARLFMPWLLDSSDDPLNAVRIEPPASTTERPVANAQSQSPEGKSGVIGEAWACRELGRGIRIATHPPPAAIAAADDDDDDYEPANDDEEDFETLEELGKGQDIRLAVFMPDGSALLGDRVWLNDESGRCGLLTISPWSGLPIFQRLADLGESLSAASERGETPADAPKEGTSGRRGQSQSDSEAPSEQVIDGP